MCAVATQAPATPPAPAARAETPRHLPAGTRRRGAEAGVPLRRPAGAPRVCGTPPSPAGTQSAMSGIASDVALDMVAVSANPQVIPEVFMDSWSALGRW